MKQFSKKAQGKVPLDMEVIETSQQTTRVVIWLHGLGADGHDFVSIIPELGLPEQAGIRFIFPHAPVRPVTINGGYQMRAWYDIRSIDLGDDHSTEEDDILTSVAWINAIIDEQIKEGIKPEKILLAGFSQGGVIALYTGLSHPQQLAGIIALSTYMPHAEKLVEKTEIHHRNLPVFSAHGTEDPIVPHESGKRYRTALLEKSVDVTVRDYPMQHSLCGEEVRDISRWMLFNLF